MKRSTGVTVAGALLIAGGIFLAFGAVMGVLGQLMMRSVSLPNWPKSDVPLVATVLVFGGEAAVAAWAILTAIGIFRLWRWAWISILVLSGVMAGFAGFALAGMIAALAMMKNMQPTPGLPPHFEQMMMVGAMFIFLIPLACGIWWLILFTRKSVRAQFEGTPAVAIAAPAPFAAAPVTENFAVTGESASKIPISIFVIGIYLVAVAPLSLAALTMPFIRRMPAMVFGKLLWPGSGWIYLLVVAAIHLVLGIGLLRRQRWALPGTAAYCIFLIANSLSMAFRPHALDQMIVIMRQSMPELTQFYPVMTAAMHRFLYFGMTFGLAPPVAALYFLWTRRGAYRAACARKA